MKKRLSNKSIKNIGIIGAAIIVIAMIAGVLLAGFSARMDAEESAREVSLLYLDELASRREEVVDSNIQSRISDIETAMNLMTDDDLSSIENLQTYQAKMKKIYNLDKFAFVDSEGLIYTSLGTQNNIAEYNFDYQNLQKPEISIFNLAQTDKKVVIAVPADKDLNGKHLVVCFMEIDMVEMLSGVLMGEGDSKSTFSNIYTKDGIALSNTVLGGLAAEDNLLDALKVAVYEGGYSFEKVVSDFSSGKKGIASFTYNGTKETLSYVPINNTDWFLTYLIRESLITDKVNTVSNNIIVRSIITSSITATLLILMFIFIIYELNRNSKIEIESEKLSATYKAKQEDNELLSRALEAAEQANRAKTIFLSNMSHEIRTPMNAIIGLDNIALNDKEISDKTRDYLQKIGASAEHLLNLINDILEMSRIESGKMTLKNECFSFRKLIEQINALFSGQCQEKKIEYHCKIKDIEEDYIGDSIKLKQVLINILGNAIKFTNSGGKVSLFIEKKAELEDKQTLEFRISDTGIGISKEFLPHVFDSFTQEDQNAKTKYGSTGLGMAITKSIVELMNGNIAVESKKNVGTTFTVTLTLTKFTGKRTNAISRKVNKNLQILIIDDDEVALEHAKIILEKEGISPTLAKSGNEALDLIKTHQARNEAYDLILIDWKMPQMDGLETTRKIREIIGKESTIIMLTAYKWDDVLDEASRIGIDGFLSKPLFASAIFDQLDIALGKKEIEPAKNTNKLKNKRILIAEDTEINAEILQEILNLKEMHSDWAKNGKEALELYTSHPSHYYDAILMDMKMPEMNGLEATQAIRNLDKADAKTIPIIALTANAFDEDVQKSLQAGLDAHLSKPIDTDLLFETLNKFIEERTD